MHSSVLDDNRKPLLIWLGFLLVLIAGMVVLGGLTRLTESGLSIVEWKPIHGTLPPLSTAEWQEEFAAYQQTPQYQKINLGMELDEFKGIFWLEYFHRLLGRLVGFAFFVPFGIFLARRMIPKPLTWKLAGIFLLGGAQGAMGWYMVKSGLVNEPMVSPLRLAAHLGLACLIFSLILWQWLKLKTGQGRSRQRLYKPALVLVTLIFGQILLGALVAGLDAGLAYDTFPTMNGQWLPDGLWSLHPWVHNLYANATTVQFMHRMGAWVVAAYLTVLLIYLYRTPLPKLAANSAYALAGGVIVQITLGALTLIHHVPVAIATLHQFVAILLLSASIVLLYAQSAVKKPA